MSERINFKQIHEIIRYFETWGYTYVILKETSNHMFESLMNNCVDDGKYITATMSDPTDMQYPSISIGIYVKSDNTKLDFSQACKLTKNYYDNLYVDKKASLDSMGANEGFNAINLEGDMVGYVCIVNDNVLGYVMVSGSKKE